MKIKNNFINLLLFFFKNRSAKIEMLLKKIKKWLCDGTYSDIVNNFAYLGMIFN